MPKWMLQSKSSVSVSSLHSYEDNLEDSLEDGLLTYAFPYRSCSGTSSDKRYMAYYESWSPERPCDVVVPSDINVEPWTVSANNHHDRQHHSNNNGLL